MPQAGRPGADDVRIGGIVEGRGFLRCRREADRPGKRTTRMNAPDRKDEPAPTELDRYGIQTVELKAYLWGGYRYTHARDAIAAAKRGEQQ